MKLDCAHLISIITAGSTELISFNVGIELSPSSTRLRGMIGAKEARSNRWEVASTRPT